MGKWSISKRIAKYSKLKDLMQRGYTPKQAADVVGCAAATARKIKRMPDDELSHYCNVSGVDLTPREKQISSYLIQGFNDAYIAKTLNLSIRTVQCCLYSIYYRLDLMGDKRIHRRVSAVNALKEIL